MMIWKSYPAIILACLDNEQTFLLPTYLFDLRKDKMFAFQGSLLLKSMSLKMVEAFTKRACLD